METMKLKVERWWKRRMARSLYIAYCDRYGGYGCGSALQSAISPASDAMWNRIQELVARCREIDSILGD